MGHVFAKLTLSNPRDAELSPVEVEAVSLEDMDLIVNPGEREVRVDPASPNIPQASEM